MTAEGQGLGKPVHGGQARRERARESERETAVVHAVREGESRRARV